MELNLKGIIDLYVLYAKETVAHQHVLMSFRSAKISFIVKKSFQNSLHVLFVQL